MRGRGMVNFIGAPRICNDFRRTADDRDQQGSEYGIAQSMLDEGRKLRAEFGSSKPKRNAPDIRSIRRSLLHANEGGSAPR
jgi:hypothetical protein